MKSTTPITTLFLDVGGVLLTNGWGHQSRALAAKAFDLNLDEMEDRHHLTFDTYEVGKLTLDNVVVPLPRTRSYVLLLKFRDQNHSPLAAHFSIFNKSDVPVFSQ